MSEYFLGLYNEEATNQHHEKAGSEYVEETGSVGGTERYHSHIYTDGTVCDLTQGQRQTEVR